MSSEPLLNGEPSRAPLLEVEHLSVAYATEADPVLAVNDVSFSLEGGKIFGLAGESGSGKSTLAYAIARLLRQPARTTQGAIRFYARGTSEALDLLMLNDRQLRDLRWTKLAMVFQSAMNALNPVMRVRTQIDHVLQTHRTDMSARERAARAAELFQLVGIAPERLKSYPHQLSGGMRQRVMIALALALDPELIIMDEPTTALDVVVQREILTKLLDLQAQRGFSIIFITHDLSLLLEIADSLAIMYAGRIIEIGERDDILFQPQHPYTQGLLNSIPTIDGDNRAMTGIYGNPPDLRHSPPGCAFAPRCAARFSPCATHMPLLRSATPAVSSHQTACHLYDPAHHPEQPSASAGSRETSQTPMLKGESV